MFGRRDDVQALEARVEALERELATLVESGVAAVRAQLDERVGELAARFEGSPEQRTEALLAAVADDLQRSLEEQLARSSRLAAASAELEERLAAASAGAARPRLQATLGRVYRADSHGYVSLFFDGGYTDKVELLVGSEDPPTDEACTLNTTNDLNSYAGTVVRPGEYWMARSKRGDRSGVRCVFTPFL